MTPHFVVKKGADYVAYPQAPAYTGASRKDEWTSEQRLAWRWAGLESGNGARLTARAIGDGARVVKLVPKRATVLPSDASGADK